MALAALMRIPRDRVVWLGAEALRRIQAAPLTDQQRFLLGECAQAYLPLDEEQQREFERLVAGPPYQGVMAMNKTWYEQGIEQGIERGRRASLREQLEDRFGPLSPSVRERLEHLSGERLTALTRAVLRARSLQELGLED